MVFAERGHHAKCPNVERRLDLLLRCRAGSPEVADGRATWAMAPHTPPPGHHRRHSAQRRASVRGEAAFVMTIRNLWRSPINLAWYLGVLAGIGIVACSEVESGRWLYTASDSAGVRIYDNHYSSHPLHWKPLANPREFANIGTPDAGKPFFEVRDIALLDNDRMAVAEESDVRIMTLAGGETVSVGRDGEGPGEFRNIVGIARLAGDSILVLDNRLMRLSVFDAAGKLAGTTQLETEGNNRLWGLHVVEDGTVIVGTAWSGRLLGGNRSPGRRRFPYRAFRYERTGELSDVIGPLPGTEVVVGRFGEATTLGMAPFGRQTTIGVSEQLLYLGTADEFEILVTRLDTGPVAIFRLGPIDFTIEEWEIEEWINHRVSQLPFPEREVAFRRSMAVAEQPKRRPAFEELVVSGEGDVWIKEFAGDFRREVLWHIMAGTNGRYCGSLALPAAFRLMDIRDGRLTGVWKDAMEVEYVRVYEITGASLGTCRTERIGQNGP